MIQVLIIVPYMNFCVDGNSSDISDFASDFLMEKTVTNCRVLSIVMILLVNPLGLWNTTIDSYVRLEVYSFSLFFFIFKNILLPEFFCFLF